VSQDEGNAVVSSIESPSQHRNDCLACLLSGLESIGISPNPDASIDFGALGLPNVYALTDAFASSIEMCLDEKGYIVTSLTDGFRQLHDQGSVVPIDVAVSALVSLSHPRVDGGQ
jgi:hypothetical protein